MQVSKKKKLLSRYMILCFLVTKSFVTLSLELIYFHWKRYYIFAVAQSPSHVQLLATPWTAAHQASLSFTFSQSLPKFMSTESVMAYNHLIRSCPLLLLCSINCPRIRVFSNESAIIYTCMFSSFQSLSHVRLFAIP